MAVDSSSSLHRNDPDIVLQVWNLGTHVRRKAKDAEPTNLTIFDPVDVGLCTRPPSRQLVLRCLSRAEGSQKTARRLDSLQSFEICEPVNQARSEECRVGKECRSRWSPHPQKNHS